MASGRHTPGVGSTVSFEFTCLPSTHGVAADDPVESKPTERQRPRPAHTGNVDRWRKLVRDADVSSLCRIMTGLDTDSIEMREVSPMGGLMPQDERSEVRNLIA